MSQINDSIMAPLGPGQINDLLLSYYQSKGAISDSLANAEFEFLAAVGATPAPVNDMWFELLTTLGYTGGLPDMKLAFWRSNGNPNVVVEGDFSLGGVNWAVGGDSTVNTGVGRCYSLAGAYTVFYQEDILTIGEDYIVEYDIIYDNGAPVYENVGTFRWPTTVGHHMVRLPATQVNISFKRQTGATWNTNVHFDNIEARLA